jgi:choice-of-anchor C domain-containing protein
VRKLFRLTRRNGPINLFGPAAILALTFGAAVPAKADLVNNGNFSGVTDPYQHVTTGNTIPGWLVLGQVNWVGNEWAGPGPGGTGDSVDLNGGGVGAIFQTAQTNIGSNYKLTFYLAGDAGNEGIVDLNVIAGGNGTHLTFDTTGKSTSNMGWTLETITFTAHTSTTLIAFVDGDLFSKYGPVVAGVEFVDPPAAPEPGFYGVLLLGFAGMAYTGYRRRQAGSLS